MGEIGRIWLTFWWVLGIFNKIQVVPNTADLSHRGVSFFESGAAGGCEVSLSRESWSLGFLLVGHVVTMYMTVCLMVVDTQFAFAV